MKIIDLLNKIANGEELPKKIYCFNREFYLKENTYFGDTFTLMHYIQEENLTDEVEIIEGEPKPLTKQDVEALGYACGEIRKCFENGWNKSLENKPFKEDKKIEKIKYYDDSIAWVIDGAGQLSDIDKIAIDKINEIIDYINNKD